MKLRTRFARATAIGALVLVAPALSACGMEMATDMVYTPAAGANDRSERVDVLNAVIVSTDGGTGTLLTTLVNNDTVAVGEASGSADKQLLGVTGNVDAEFGSPVTILAGDYVRIATVGGAHPDRADKDIPGIRVSGDFEIGQFVEVTLQFDEGVEVTLEVPVVANNGYWACQDGPELTPNHLGDHAEDPNHPAGPTECAAVDDEPTA